MCLHVVLRVAAAGVVPGPEIERRDGVTLFRRQSPGGLQLLDVLLHCDRTTVICDPLPAVVVFH